MLNEPQVKSMTTGDDDDEEVVKKLWQIWQVNMLLGLTKVQEEQLQLEAFDPSCCTCLSSFKAPLLSTRWMFWQHVLSISGTSPLWCSTNGMLLPVSDKAPWCSTTDWWKACSRWWLSWRCKAACKHNWCLDRLLCDRLEPPNTCKKGFNASLH